MTPIHQIAFAGIHHKEHAAHIEDWVHSKLFIPTGSSTSRFVPEPIPQLSDLIAKYH